MPCLPIEAAAIPNAGTELPEGDAEFASERESGRPDRLMAMRVLVRIEMGRIAAHHPAKFAQLPLQLLGDHGVLIERDDAVHGGPALAVVLPFTEVEVEADI